ncbi:Na/Pi symporter [Aliikangiella maris]|uniref:Na/Pi symporter n=2 Tax=Aliikangiella maris TaxID=3162458 RepID=A0ABV3MRU3_9GAMM
MNFWALLAGLGFFILGMRELESGLSGLSHQRLQLILKKHTDTPFKGVIFGTIATAILQSSSLLSLIILAFASASLLSLAGSLALIFGANLGTTFTGWIITTLGFKFDFASISYVLIGGGALGLTLLNESSNRYLLFKAITGLGLLILGLNEMKDATMIIRDQIDIAALQEMPVWVFFVAGVVIASIIQSSSATIGITLAAMNAGMIDLIDAGALVIGADLGTTSTLLLGALGGASVKKQIAAGQIIFNFVTNIVALFCLLPFLKDILQWLNITDPLYGLVIFHTVFNFLGIAAFFPFLKHYALWLEKVFHSTQDKQTLSLDKVDSQITEAAIKAAFEDIAMLAKKITVLTHKTLNLQIKNDSDFLKKYAELKRLESHILQYLLLTQTNASDAKDKQIVLNLIQSIRYAILAAKSIKDIRHNIVSIYQTQDGLQSFESLREFLMLMLVEVNRGLLNHKQKLPDNFHQLEGALVEEYEKQVAKVYYEYDIHDKSSLLNVIRELTEFARHLNKSVILLVDSEQLIPMDMVSNNTMSSDIKLKH